MTGFGALAEHLPQLRDALGDLERHEAVLHSWAWQLADVFRRGGRLLAAGNGGSAAQAQHLTAELVGRFELDRPPLSAIALHAETSSLTAIVNDFGADDLFARQVEAHGRDGDVLILLSTSGRSANLLRAADRGLACGLRVWALTGPQPNPLAGVAHTAIAIDCDSTTVIQEIHLVAVHALAAEVERRLIEPPLPPGRRRLHSVPRGHTFDGHGLDGRGVRASRSRITSPMLPAGRAEGPGASGVPGAPGVAGVAGVGGTAGGPGEAAEDR
jgi:D-sedoheptulose 7-phosphate isomerase